MEALAIGACARLAEGIYLKGHARAACQGGLLAGRAVGEHPQAPWRGKVSVKECDAGFHLNTWMVSGEIDYADGVVTIE